MTTRLLGYAVLVYSVLTSFSALPLVGIVMGHWDGDWWAIWNAGIWLSFVAGGGALVAGRAWGRPVLLIAALAEVSTEVLAIVFFWNTDVTILGTSSVLSILVPVAIIVGVRKLPTSALSTPGVPTESAGTAELQDGAPGTVLDPQNASHRVDLAYACYAWIAFVTWVEDLGRMLPIDPEVGGALLMLVSLPIIFATLFAGIAACVISIIERRHLPLVVMMGATAAMLFLSLVVGYVEPLWYVVGTAIITTFCIRWFAFTRPRRAARIQ